MGMTKNERKALIDRYAKGPELLRAAWGKTPEVARKWRPGPKRWSAHEIVVHCGDAETNAAGRIRYLVCEKDPLIVGYDQEVWTERLDYHAHPAELALAAVDAVRANTAALLQRMSDEEWAREGRHTESGRYGAEEWLRLYSEHAEKHARQIERNLEAWRAANPAPASR